MKSTLLVCALVAYATLILAVGAARSDFRDPRNGPPYASLQTMVFPGKLAEVLKPTVSKVLSKEASSSGHSGITYLEFYAEANCGGSITYSTGYKSNLCLPANDYVRPPFADDDDFYYKFPFQSLRISNLTDSCDGWYTTYYTDVNCTDIYNVMQLNDFTDCRPATEIKVSNMLSVRGMCSFSTDPLPVHADSFIISDYTGKEQCDPSELVSFTAYSTNTCFGYGNFSSTMFMYNTTANAIQETQFYASNNCTRTASEYGQSDYTINAAGGVCNPVQSPNSPVDDDSVAWTEYVGLSYFVAPTVAPTAIPSAIPSALPTAKPTRQPTVAPTPNNLVLFSATQVISGISLSTYNSNSTLYGNTLRMSIAACMQGVQPSNIINLQVTGVSSSAQAPSSLLESLLDSSSAQINAAYEVSVHDASLSYSTLSQQLSAAVTAGTFDDYLAFYGSETGATGFEGATSSSVETQDLTPTDDDGGSDKKGLRPGVIAGIVLAVVAFVLVVAVVVYFFVFRNRGASATAARSPSTGVAVEVETRVSYGDSAAVKAKAASAPEGPGTTNPLSSYGHNKV